jgi:hypothetical protein
MKVLSLGFLIYQRRKHALRTATIPLVALIRRARGPSTTRRAAATIPLVALIRQARGPSTTRRAAATIPLVALIRRRGAQVAPLRRWPRISVISQCKAVRTFRSRQRLALSTLEFTRPSFVHKPSTSKSQPARAPIASAAPVEMMAVAGWILACTVGSSAAGRQETVGAEEASAEEASGAAPIVPLYG